MHTKLKAEFWSDDDVAGLDTEAKLALLWLMSNSNLSCAGVTTVSRRQFAFDTGIPFDALQRACHAHSKGIVVDGKFVWLRNYIRHQVGQGAALMRNRLSSTIRSAVAGCASEKIRKAIQSDYPELFLGQEKVLTSPSDAHAIPMPSPSDAHSKGIVSPCHGVGEGEGEGEGDRGGVGEGRPQPNGAEIPSKAEWLKVCEIAGLPVWRAEYEWNRLGARDWQLGHGVRLTVGGLHHHAAVVRTWWEAEGKPGEMQGRRIGVVEGELDELKRKILAHPANRDGSGRVQEPTPEQYADLDALRKELTRKLNAKKEVTCPKDTNG